MLSLITVAHGRRPQLEALLAAATRTDPAPAEVVVVDMGGEPWTAPAGVPVTVVDMTVTGGPAIPVAAARNRGAAAASSSLLLFLDVDCRPAPDLVAEMHAALERHHGLVMADVRYVPEGIESDAGGVGDVPRLPETDDAGPDDLADVPVDVSGELFGSTAFGVRRAVFEQLGGFCEAYVGYGGEDTDLGLTAAAAGVPISQSRRAAVHTHHQPSPDVPTEHVASIVRNSRVFHQRWGRWPMTAWLAELAELGLVAWRPEVDELELVRPPDLSLSRGGDALV